MDKGLQPQRTALAWSRTALAILINAVLFLRAGFIGDNELLITLGAITLLASALTAGYGQLRESRFRGSSTDNIAVSHFAISFVALAAVISALAGLQVLLRM